jgi:hypothetical protein
MTDKLTELAERKKQMEHNLQCARNHSRAAQAAISASKKVLHETEEELKKERQIRENQLRKEDLQEHLSKKLLTASQNSEGWDLPAALFVTGFEVSVDIGHDNFCYFRGAPPVRLRHLEHNFEAHGSLESGVGVPYVRRPTEAELKELLDQFAHRRVKIDWERCCKHYEGFTTDVYQLLKSIIGEFPESLRPGGAK